MLWCTCVFNSHLQCTYLVFCNHVKQFIGAFGLLTCCRCVMLQLCNMTCLNFHHFLLLPLLLSVQPWLIRFFVSLPLTHARHIGRANLTHRTRQVCFVVEVLIQWAVSELRVFGFELTNRLCVKIGAIFIQCVKSDFALAISAG